MRSSEKIFSKRNCTHHQRHRRRHPVPFLILTCVRQPQRLARRLPRRDHQGAAVSDCRLIEGDFQVAHLEKRKPWRLDGVSPYQSVLPKISLVGRRSEEPQKDNFPIYPQRPQNSQPGGSTSNTASAGSRYHPTLPAHLGRWAKLFQQSVRTAVCVGSRVTAKASS